MPKIGLITVLYHSDVVLPPFVESLAKQTHQDAVLYLIDNSPNEKTRQLIKTLFAQNAPNIQYHHKECTTNTGFALGNNIGIQQAIQEHCDYIVLLNNDIEIPQNDFLEKMLICAQEKPNDILVPKFLYADGKTIWAAGGYHDTWRALGVHEGMGKASDCFTVSKYISFSPACFWFIPVELFQKIGLLDERFFAYTEDTDFLYRATQKKVKIWYEASLVILHKVSFSTGGDNSEFYIYYSNRNKIYFINKHYKGFLRMASLVYFLCTRIVFYLKFKPQQRKKLMQGIRDGFTMH